jgi:hypothetical protein
MITQQLGYRFTGPGLPGLAEIRIEPSEHSDRGVRITLDDGSGDAPRAYGVTEFAILVGALNKVRELADKMAQANDEEASGFQ